MDLLADAALQLGRRRARSPRRSGSDKIHHRLRLRQIELAVEEGPLGELSGPGHTCPSLKHCGQNTRSNKRPSMAADLDQILAGVAAGILEKGEQNLVDDLALCIDDSSEDDVPFLEVRGALRASKNCVSDGHGKRSADPYHGKRPFAGRCGQRGNGLLHGYFLRTSFSSSMQRRFWSMVPTEMRIHSGMP